MSTPRFEDNPDFESADRGFRHRLTLHNGALTHRPMDADSPPRTPAGLTLTVSRPQLIGLLAGQGAEEAEHDGDLGLLERLFALTAVPDMRFRSPQVWTRTGPRHRP
jgi:alkyl sulfatase BDS1-like metallo-beta-lactamase superfamily hydrolase